MITETLTSLNCNGTLLDLRSPVIMGIVNITPDSFYDGSEDQNYSDIHTKIKTMLNEGAQIIDIGGQSSRPGAPLLTWEQEWSRLEPFVKKIRDDFPNAILSIDTFYSEIVKRTDDLGVNMVNDISAGNIDPNLFDTISKSKMAYVLMHMRGTPGTMQAKPFDNQTDIVLQILTVLKQKFFELSERGKVDIAIDPGFGFGKSVEQNYRLLEHLSVFEIFRRPLLVGLSRKSMIYKALDIGPEDALNGTTALHMVALQNGARILRVHDVEQAKQTITLFQMLKS